MALAAYPTGQCGTCNVCEKACPEGAITTSGGNPRIHPELCTRCGIALPLCGGGIPRDAELPALAEMLASGRPVVALVDPSWERFFVGPQADSLVGRLKDVGFAKVLRLDAFISAVIEEYVHLLHAGFPGTLLASTCPTLVSLVENRFPQVVPLLAPVVSPMTAAARFSKLAIPGCAVVYIGPCVGKKIEAARLENEPTADLALTFGQLQEFLAGRETADAPPRFRPFDTELIPGMPIEHEASLPRAGLCEVLTAFGSETALQVLRGLSQGILTPRLVEIAFCGQCGLALCVANRFESAGASPCSRADLPPASLPESVNLTRRFDGTAGRKRNLRSRAGSAFEHEDQRALTSQELRVLGSLGRGLDNRAIAARLFISENTVKIHLKNIYRKLGVNSRVQAVLIATSRGLIK